LLVLQISLKVLQYKLTKHIIYSFWPMSLTSTTPVYTRSSLNQGCQVSGSITACLVYAQKAKMPFIWILK